MISLATPARIATPAAPGPLSGVTVGAGNPGGVAGDFAGALTAMIGAEGGAGPDLATGCMVAPATIPIPDTMRQEVAMPIAEPGKDLPVAGPVVTVAPDMRATAPMASLPASMPVIAVPVSPQTAAPVPSSPLSVQAPPPAAFVAAIADPAAPERLATVLPVPVPAGTTTAALATSALTPVPSVPEAEAPTTEAPTKAADGAFRGPKPVPTAGPPSQMVASRPRDAADTVPDDDAPADPETPSPDDMPVAAVPVVPPILIPVAAPPIVAATKGPAPADAAMAAPSAQPHVDADARAPMQTRAPIAAPTATPHAAGTPTMQVAAAIMAALPMTQAPSALTDAAPASPTVAANAVPAQATAAVPPPAVPASRDPAPLAAAATTSPADAARLTAPSIVIQSIDAPQASSPASASQPVTADAPTGRTEPTRWSTPAATAVSIAPVALQPAPVQPGTVASAAQVFGAAMQAFTQEDRPVATAPTDPVVAAMAALAAPATVAPIADAKQAPLDMRQDAWPETMIARIEVLRDMANATDTRMRLIPDALGAIDVSVKRDGDTVHVHFAAEQAATRTLLQDAQPRLTELAESRGLKLAQTQVAGSGVDSGVASGGGQQQRHAATPQPATPAAPPRARATPAETDSTDTRLA